MTTTLDAPARPETGDGTLERPPFRRKREPLPIAALWVIVCALIACLFLFPLVMVALTSVKTPAEAVASPPTVFPTQLSFDNFVHLWNAGSGLAVYLGNSLSVSLMTVVFTLVLSTLAGYGLARMPFKRRSLVFLLLLAPMMVPLQALLTPLYVTLLNLHLNDSLLGLAFVYTVSQVPFGTFVMRNAFAAIPAEIEEAAWVDGCGILGGAWRVSLRLVGPGIATVALFAFFTAWNEFLAALVLLSSDDRFTVPVLLQNLTTGKFGTIDWGMLQVGVLVTSIPCIAIFLLLQRYYVEGLLAGSVKS
ncbi:carbohydrate ABC transporter permease [Leifsonia sp. C5G2]|uniref:carbohydrate ABC transporter permease n=1 Tax=Leifsonia sp. C5G2 TaxID=2735269 RepID=UPI0015856003|nr:carbohydrate ABC transporter permease [Leifsonia sp. C5G2]NUU05230.1 carbohydrate ABC transporter permease [Leifsonia sp. C5G2]